MSWWTRIRENLRTRGLTYICPSGHEFEVSAEAVSRSIHEDVGYLPEKCPGCPVEDAGAEKVA